MNKIKDFLDKYNLSMNRVQYKKTALVIDNNKETLLIKKRKRADKKKIKEYLESKNFNYSLFQKNDFQDDYELYSYITEVKTIKEEKAINLIYILADLQNRTTTYKEYTLDEIKEIYESKNKDINNLLQYYNNLEEVYSSYVYPSPSGLLLLNNISKIYNALEYSKMVIEDWYKKITENKKRRIVLLHNHLSLEHYLDGKDKKVLINWDYIDYGSPIYDFIYFYKKHFYELDMNCLFDIYQSKYNYTETEMLLFFVELLIPDKLSLTNNNCNNTLYVNHLVNYVDSTREFILKQKQKEKKKDNKEFSQK